MSIKSFLTLTGMDQDPQSIVWAFQSGYVVLIQRAWHFQEQISSRGSQVTFGSTPLMVWSYDSQGLMLLRGLLSVSLHGGFLDDGCYFHLLDNRRESQLGFKIPLGRVTKLSLCRLCGMTYQKVDFGQTDFSCFSLGKVIISLQKFRMQPLTNYIIPGGFVPKRIK